MGLVQRPVGVATEREMMQSTPGGGRDGSLHVHTHTHKSGRESPPGSWHPRRRAGRGRARGGSHPPSPHRPSLKRSGINSGRAKSRRPGAPFETQPGFRGGRAGRRRGCRTKRSMLLRMSRIIDWQLSNDYY
eukprot:3632073-Prymnesium_polylepis.2